VSTNEAAAEADVAVAEPEQQQKAKPKKKPPKRQPRYHVILWNDDDHSYDYVVEMMQKLFGHPREKGLQIANGKVLALTEESVLRMWDMAAVRLENFDMVASFGLGGGAARAACSPNSGPGRSNQWTLVVGRWS